jgi:hemoglobin
MGETLYDRLGGSDGIETVVEEFYDRVLADESLAHFFEATDTDALRDHQRAFLTMVAGGPDEYDGPDMRTAHRHLDIGEADFEKVAKHLDDALRSSGVADEDREAVMKEVAGLEDAVLNR